MAISLSKGQKISLTKAASDSGVQLTKVNVGLGWDVNQYDGGFDFDLDASAFMLGADGKVRSDADFIFYGQKDSADGSVHHTGDNLTGAGDGDDETIEIDLSRVPDDVQKIAVAVTIYEADTRSQNFGMVSNSYVRIYDVQSGTELIRYDLGEDYSVETAIVVGELYRHGNEWKFSAVGSGYSGGLGALGRSYGVNIG